MAGHRRPLVRVLAAAVAVLAVAGCSSASAGGDTNEGTGYVAGDGSTVVLPQGERQAAPELAGTTLDGGTWSSANAAGDIVVANVWASWCAPCRAEAPVLERVHKANADAGVQFVGIDTRDSEAAARAFVTRYGITYPNLVDTDGQLQLRFRDTLPPQAIPSTVFIDKQGRVAARILGEADAARLQGIIDTLQQETA